MIIIKTRVIGLWANNKFINTLPKFYGMEPEDAYFFIREFKEACLMMRIAQLGDNIVRLHFILFSLNNLAKK